MRSILCCCFFSVRAAGYLIVCVAVITAETHTHKHVHTDDECLLPGCTRSLPDICYLTFIFWGFLAALIYFKVLLRAALFYVTEA